MSNGPPLNLVNLTGYEQLQVIPVNFTLDQLGPFPETVTTQDIADLATNLPPGSSIYDMYVYTPWSYVNGQVLWEINALRPIFYSANLAGSIFTCDTAPTANALVLLQTNHGSTTLGTVTYLAGQTTGTVSGISAAGSFATSTNIRLTAPATADATFAGFQAALAFNR